ncbi:MAG: hypothetical protein Q8K75_03840, partial [Chlamydiales bacterium]|nr:hypothetical protein [Chlamydiales bacterium]
FFEGDYKTLSRNPWSKPLEKWLTSIEGEERAGLANFFEKHALMGGTPPGYTNSKLYRLLHLT